jgi:hypothetical protein
VFVGGLTVGLIVVLLGEVMVRSFCVLILAVACVAGSVACSKDSTATENRKTSSNEFIETDEEQRTTIDENGTVMDTFRYSYNENGCKTGEQTFTSRAALCAGLRDEELNSHCARVLRLREFESLQCKGDFYADLDDQANDQTNDHATASIAQ